MLMAFCPNCGAERLPEERFCASCGFAFVALDGAPLAEQLAGSPARPMSQRGRLTVAVIVIVVLLAAGGALTGWGGYERRTRPRRRPPLSVRP